MMETAQSADQRVANRRPRRRLGCIFALALWFVCALVPCLGITLATQGEFTVSLGSFPDQQLRVWLVSEAQERGIGYSLPTISQSGENAVCVQTDVRYLLWAGSGDTSVFCDCYARESTAASWSLTTTQSGACPR
ncbi:MAG: hypothetical protein U0670_24995 [Anaerolineae bacterium]